jgi:hypothetical protein
VAEIGEIVRHLTRVVGLTAEQVRRVSSELTPDPDAPSPDAGDVMTALRAGREPALRALLSRLVPERVAAELGGDGARQHVAAVLNAPLPPRAPLSVEFVHTLQARVQALEECNRLLALALVEALYPSPRVAESVCVGTASRGRSHRP